ncbi:hypothetical protein Glove_256g176 [Diversispora epigaea]|uniref:Uncharacterized protein n=1 Tax=Diversispora epigaea TaxID=1348612 RepID=A0A397IBJ8_9GLOM|nr:hypothetical protein Glove_256g176 [Diversispora epigaea]
MEKSKNPTLPESLAKWTSDNFSSFWMLILANFLTCVTTLKDFKYKTLLSSNILTNECALEISSRIDKKKFVSNTVTVLKVKIGEILGGFNPLDYAVHIIGNLKTEKRYYCESNLAYPKRIHSDTLSIFS